MSSTCTTAVIRFPATASIDKARARWRARVIEEETARSWPGTLGTCLADAGREAWIVSAISGARGQTAD